ncbi:MAG: hypothetical protein KGJ32_03660 [Xanthomonadaceae bacterium]|nr:hypothetical protein [Xanthomonadaceae bacterium]
MLSVSPSFLTSFNRSHVKPFCLHVAAASLLDRAHALHAEVIDVDDPEEEWEPVRLRATIMDAPSKEIARS